MEEIKGLIFDLDGVLVDTAVYHFKGWKRLADELGIDFTEKDNERLKGVSREDSLEILLGLGSKSYSPDEKVEMATRKNDWYLSYVNEIKPGDELPGARKTLIQAKEAGLKISLGSSSKNAKKVLKLTDLEQYFDAIADGTMIKKAKPDPELFLLAASLLDIDPGNCLVFEDAKAGILAAKNGGMKTVSVGDPNILRDADYHVPSLANFNLFDLPFNLAHNP